MTTKKIEKILEILKKKFPDAKTELNFGNEFQFLVAVILSARNTDKQVNKVTENLFKIIQKPSDIIKMGLVKFTNQIKSIGLYNNKAKNIFNLSKILLKNKIPNTEEELVKLPGVGIKTANVILNTLFRQKVIAVDTHVHRVTNRLGIVNTKTPEKTSVELAKIIPDKYKAQAHHLFIFLGRYQCISRKPKCESCELRKLCSFGNHS